MLHLAKHRVAAVTIFVVLAVATAAIGAYYCYKVDTKLTAQVFTQRETVASLAAASIKVKMDSLVAIDRTYASDPRVIADAAAGRWDQAESDIIDLQKNPKNYNYFIGRFLLLDTRGNVQSAFPGIASEGFNQPDEALAEFQGPLLQQGADVFVSDVFRRNVYPYNNHIEILVPIRSGNSLVGIAEVTVPINEFSEFGTDVDLGNNGFVYIVDRLGHIISHPKYSADGDIVDYSSIATVQAVMQGQSGTMIHYNPFERQERVTAYEPVPVYGWGVLAQEPILDAFAARNGLLSEIAFLTLALIVLEGALVLGTFAVLAHLADRGKRDNSKRSGFTLIELLIVIAIIAILAVVVVITLNPTQLLAQSRDANRISDFSTLKTAMSLFSADGGTNFASSSKGYTGCYLSTPTGVGTTASKCGLFSSAGITTNVSSSASNYRKTDSTGWVPVDLALSEGSPLSALPIDPVNDKTNYYAYAANSSGYFEFATKIESKKYSSGNDSIINVSTDTFASGSSISL